MSESDFTGLMTHVWGWAPPIADRHGGLLFANYTESFGVERERIYNRRVRLVAEAGGHAKLQISDTATFAPLCFDFSFYWGCKFHEAKWSWDPATGIGCAQCALMRDVLRANQLITEWALPDIAEMRALFFMATGESDVTDRPD